MTLPPKGIVASVPVLEICTGAVRAALACAADNRLPDEEAETPLPRASLSFAPGEEKRFLQYLVEVGLLGFVAAEDIWQVRGQRLLSGMFGVEKASKTISERDSRLRLRLIFNLRPSNAAQEMIHGDLDQLPTSAQWSS